jgi:hypothetical protein
MQIRRLIIGVVAAVAACGGDSAGPDGLTPVAALTIADLPDTLLTRQTLQLTASAADDDGSLLPDRPLAWMSSDPDVVSITAGGTLTARTPGVATISVGTGAAADSANVVVRSLNFAHVFAGPAVSCGLEVTGDAWCWGNVGAEGYGNGSLDSARTLVPLRAAKGHAFASLAVGYANTCGVELSGSVVCWGANGSGELGEGTTASDQPVTVPGISDAVQLVAGWSHYCARTSAGAVYCWGSKEWKQSGLDARSHATPPHAVSLSGRATDLSAGDYHTCALVSGVSYCWGADYSRQLGNDTTYDRLVPVLAATGDGVNHVWAEVEASESYTCGRDAAGAMYCWGTLQGNGDNDQLEWLPARLLNGITVSDVAAGSYNRCAVTASGTAWCQQAPGDPVTQLTVSDVRAIGVVYTDPCVLDASGMIRCHHWPLPEDSLEPVPVPAHAVQLVTAGSWACGVDAEHAVFCWSTDAAPNASRWFAGDSVSAAFAALSDVRVCVITTAGAVYCRSSPTAAEVTEPTGGMAFDSLAVGGQHTCGLTTSGAAWCWGKNDHGQLGDGTTTDRAAPVAVGGGHVFVQITAGWDHTCGRTAAGEIWCWGNGSWGSMGDDHRDESAAPVTVDGLPSLTAMAGSCGLDGSGSAWCWPTSFSIPGAHQIGGATGLATIAGPCGLRATGEMLCWGSNYSGWFGNGTYNNTYTNAIAGGNGLMFKEVSLGAYGAVCGIALDGATYCWGSGYSTVPEKMIGSP